MTDDERRARARERSARYRERHRELVRAKCSAYKKAHPEVNRKNSRDYYHRYKELYEYYRVSRAQRCEEDAEFYALTRKRRREIMLRHYRRKHPNAKPYTPRPSTRIPDYYAKGECSAARGSFLRENCDADTIAAMKAYARELAIERRNARWGLRE